MKRIAPCLALLLCLTSVPAVAEPVIRQIPFTAKLPLPVPFKYDFEFRLWTSPTPGDPLDHMVWSEPKQIKLRSRTLKHLLGSVTPFSNPGLPLPPVDFSQQLWVEVARLRGGTYEALPGRKALAVAPYALYSESGGSMPPGSITTEMIVGGSITNVLISGPIEGAKIAGTVPDADTVDGQHAAAFAAGDHGHFGADWMGTSAPSGYGLRVENVSTGDGIRAFTYATSPSFAALWAENRGAGAGTGVFASSAGGDGIDATTSAAGKSAVYGHSTDGFGGSFFSTNSVGMQAHSTNLDGVEATTGVAGRSAFYGHSTDGFGATFRSTNTHGLQVAGNDISGTDHLADVLLEGVRGEILAPGSFLNLASNGAVNIKLDEDNNSPTNNSFQIFNGANIIVFAVDEAGDIVANGTLTLGGSKSGVVQTATYGQRLLYAVESPEVWFEDLGAATLVEGTATVSFEPIFAETVDLAVEYRLIVSAICQEPVVLFVTAKTAAGFTVKGVGLDGSPSSCGFDYRVAAKRLGYEDVRLAEPVNAGAMGRGKELLK